MNMYHYDTCGLDNVWLCNGYSIKETPYGQAVAIHDADQLHAVLAELVALKQGRLLPKEIRFLRVHLQHSQAKLGDLVGVDEQSVSLWERDRRKMPRAAEALLRVMVLDKFRKRRSATAVIGLAAADVSTKEAIVAKETDGEWESELADSEAMCDELVALVES